MKRTMMILRSIGGVTTPANLITTTSASRVMKDIVHQRVSAKRFLPNQTIDPRIMKDILENTLRSPSSFNLQPTQIILVQNQALKGRLAQDCMLGIGNQYRTRDASVVALFCSDLEITKRIHRIQALERDYRDANYLNMLPIVTSFLAGEGHVATLMKQVATSVLSYAPWSFPNKQNTSSQPPPMPTIEPVQAWVYKSTSLAVQTYVLSATAHNLATSIMEGYDARRIQTLLNIPDRYAIPMAVATGFDYHDEQDKNDENKTSNTVTQTPRLPLEEVCFMDTFGVPYHPMGKEVDTKIGSVLLEKETIKG